LEIGFPFAFNFNQPEAVAQVCSAQGYLANCLIFELAGLIYIKRIIFLL